MKNHKAEIYMIYLVMFFLISSVLKFESGLFYESLLSFLVMTLACIYLELLNTSRPVMKCFFYPVTIHAEGETVTLENCNFNSNEIGIKIFP